MLLTLHASKHSPDNATVTVQSPDTDVFVLLLYFCQKIPKKVFFDTANGDKWRLLDVNAIIADTDEDICMILTALHAFLECDSTNAFVPQRQSSSPEVVAEEHRVC